MAEDLVANGVYQSTTYIVDGAQTAVLDRFYEVTAFDPGVPGTTQNVADLLSTLWAGTFKALINDNAVYRGVAVRRVSGAAPFKVQANSSIGIGPGTAGPISLPKQTAGVIALYAVYLGKRFRGRQFVPFPASADDAGDGTPSAGYAAKLLAHAAKLIAGISIAGSAQTILTPGLWHRSIPAIDSIVTFRLRGIWSTIKSRGDYGRANTSPI